MKKFLSIVMSIVMLISITAGANLSAYAYYPYDGLPYATNIEFNTTYRNYASNYDYLESDNWRYHVYKVTIPYDGTLNIKMSSECYNYFSHGRIKIINANNIDTEYCRDSLRENTGYNGEYYNSLGYTIDVGTYYIIYDYAFRWDYYGLYNITFTYKADIPKPSNIKVSSSSYSGFTVNWSKVANVDGYLIKFATKSDFSNAATVKVANGKTTSKTINGRAANTKYYVKVQAYKNVNGVTYKSKWSETKTVKTLQKKAYIKSISSRANGFTVKWDKVNGKLGYQIRYATKPDFSNAATIYAGNGNATSKTITGRAARKKYYVQIRSYVKQNGKYKFDSWSPTKTVTTK